jgi:prepilin-type N-terminal cleavage/methylation domain-containing protein
MSILHDRRKKERGFSLVELMIVIAVIALIIGVGIPAWQIMMKAGNENSAIQTLDRIRTFQSQYAATHSGQFANFDDLIKNAGLDDKFKGDKPAVNGYVYTITVQKADGGNPAFYKLNADPQVKEGIQSTGSRHFYIDSTLSTIKQNENQPAGPADPSV